MSANGRPLFSTTPVATTYRLDITADELWVLDTYSNAEHMETPLDIILLRNTKAYDIFHRRDLDGNPAVVYTIDVKNDTATERKRIAIFVEQYIADCWACDEWIREHFR